MNKPVFLCCALYAAGIGFGLFPAWRGGTLLIVAAILAPLLLRKEALQAKRLLLWIGCFSIGLGYGLWTLHANRSHLPDSMENMPIHTEGVIVSPPKVDGDKAAFAIRSHGERLLVNVKLEAQPEQNTVRSWQRGDRVALDGMLEKPQTAGNFQAFDYAQYLTGQRIHWIAAVAGADSVHILTGKRSWAGSAGWIGARFDSWRNALAGRLDRHTDGDVQGVMEGLLLGVRDHLSPEGYARFSDLGISHVLSISGLHVGIVLGGFIGLCRLLRMTRETRLRLALGFIPLFVMMTGASAAVCRAGIMAELGLIAVYRRMYKDSLYLAGLAGALMLGWNPYYLTDIGFQLSFLITIGLLIGVPVFQEIAPLKPKLLRDALSVALTAEIVSFPLIVSDFNAFSLLSPLANLLLVPVYSLIVLPLGYAVLGLDLIHPSLAHYPGECLQLLTDFTFRLMDRANGVQGAHLIWGTPPIWWVVLYYGLLEAICHVLIRWKRAGRVPWLRPSFARFYPAACVLLVLLFGATLLDGYDPYLFQPRRGQVDFLDVGQGDACLIHSPAGKNILIDGGGTLSFLKNGESWRQRRDPYEVGKDLLVPLLKKRGVHRIDYLVLSHEDADHIGGLREVVRQIPVGLILFNGTLKDSSVARTLFELALAKHIPLIPVRSGDDFAIDGGTAMTVLYPETEGSPAVVRDDVQNMDCVVLLMRMSGYAFLFTGDIPSEAEDRIVADHPELKDARIDVLKVAHHGSKSSTDDNWLDFFHPRQAVISVGSHNPYGHPSPLVLQRLEERSIAVFRTDQDGELQFVVAPGKLKLRAKRERGPA